MDDREFLQRLDALRPNRSDLEQLGNTDLQERLASDGEAFELYERIQSADARIGAAFRDVESPVGLEQRILSRLVADDVNDDEEIPDDRVAVASPVGGASPAECVARFVPCRSRKSTGFAAAADWHDNRGPGGGRNSGRHLPAVASRSTTDIT